MNTITQSTKPKLSIQNISKSYGNVQALKNLSLELRPGIYGLLGANGSGKSTLLNIISQNLKADSGEVKFEANADILDVLGFMPQEQSVYKNMSARAFMYYMASLKEVKKPQEQIESLLKEVNLAAVAHQKMKSFSGGMKQRILLAQALLGNPKVLLLDEPTAGLDPIERIRIRNLISSFSEDKIIILATHVVSDIEYIANKVIIIKNGVLLGVKAISEWLLEIQDKVYEVTVPNEEITALQEKYLVANIYHSVDGIRLRIVSDEKPHKNAVNVNPKLEDVYLYYNGADLFTEDTEINRK